MTPIFRHFTSPFDAARPTHWKKESSRAPTNRLGVRSTQTSAATTPVGKIPFNRPSFAGGERAYIAEALERNHISGDGEFTARCQGLLERELGVTKALLTTSCTHALEMAALLLDVRPGDEVIIPAFTFVSTANAFVLRGAKPVFVDIRPDTLNIDERLVPDKITGKTKAIIVVHYAGVACSMDSIMGIADAHGIPVVEDNAHGIFARFRGRFLGTFGPLATLSFHETKNFTCGEGGALLLNDSTMVERAEIIREKGTNRSRFFRGQVDKYTWVDVGSSYLPSDILAAFLLAQLEAKTPIQEHRRRVWHVYDDSLRPWAAHHGVSTPTIPVECEQSYHMYYLILPSPKSRSKLIDFLKKRNISAVFHYQPLHLSDMGRRFGGNRGDCPVTERISDRLLRLPFYNQLTPQEQQRVIDAVLEFKDW
jgi:dTDP-4-amino-4,6-dideoxygalactose transaminase